MATLVPCLVALRGEFNTRFPNRDKTSDGWIGDPAHQASKSDHNPDSRGLVHAIDVDEDLRDPYGVTSMRDCVNVVVERHRRGVDNRLTYVIYERTIWSAAYGWRARTYTGSNPHDKHAHFSASYVKARERNTAPWGIRTLEVPTVTQPAPPTAAQVADAVWAKIMQIPGTTGTAGQRTAGTLLQYLYSKESIAARVVELLWGDLAAGGTEGTPLYELADEIRKVREGLDVLLRDPADTGNPEGHPIVMAMRYVQNNPPA